MKIINLKNTIAIPEDVKLEVKARVVTVTGERGTLTRSFKYVRFDIYKTEDGKQLVLESWFGDRRTNSKLNTVTTHIENLIKGVRLGYRYKMRFVYAHFPVNTKITKNNTAIEIRNFLGEKIVREVDMLEGVTITETGNKDEIAIEGNDIEKVSQSAANVHTSTLVKRKDIRKFLDGIYVSHKGHIKQED
eukprot:NODE_4257_length_681_cov_68.403481_g3622_i0.p1 GENE.NODE_4257_length_681_cov_68.403481_g3622_i0~~NODE_4257_length_681_cov_68.403481_g3622_i0.p1  ORF type:complete len:190 (-),score=0.73 NODE_4257_length_681_cov_68.403481_g3622_i0:42-611(-)